MKRSATSMVMAVLLCTGCMGSPLGLGLTAAAMNRYNDIPPDGRKGDTRFQDYTACVEKDNTSWDVIDACMVGRGYTVKK